ncbi:VWA domain-containing protein [Sulfurimonas sp. C5]|uniref:VWA domain-containing protein n=1 Tax=Sulfurimonas sp. C5 TaxID=3036947 RepID=UPI0024547693|nr:VWA domain-containing protein [Sulfurimonas sp. C5]MDH4945378.1 VWA domain-containing protein [Sulfurimonas sp. C5]
MNFYSFEYPYLIILLLPILWCLYKCKEHIVQKYFVHLHLMSTGKRYLKIDSFLRVLIFTLLVAALASPIAVDKTNPNNRFGKDIVLALDASGSMNASGFLQDKEAFDQAFKDSLHVSRFDITKYIAKEFIEKRVNDNVGIVLYGDFAFIASPITYEKNVVVDMLEYLTQGMAGQNTAIGEAIAMSVRAFAFSKAKNRVIILLSDGEHNSGNISPKDAAKLAIEKNIKIYTIAIGEADSALMEKIAQESGGKYFSAKNATQLQEVYEDIDAMESSKIKSSQYKVKNYLYQSIVIIAIALLLFLVFREMKK